jgi:hypothetical protein
MEKSEQDILKATWCPRCGALKGIACKKIQMHRNCGAVPPHAERIAQFERRMKKAQAT